MVTEEEIRKLAGGLRRTREEVVPISVTHFDRKKVFLKGSGGRFSSDPEF